MENLNYSQELGEALGRDGVEHLVERADEICTHERRQIELSNEPEIVRLQMELAIWHDEERRLGEKLRLAPPSGDPRSRRREARLSIVVALLLTVSGFFFTLLAFEPFRLGPKSYLYCFGIALTCPYGVHKFLKEWNCRQIITGLATIAAIAALTSLVLLAVIRGNLFIQEIKQAETQVIVTDDGAQNTQSAPDFYETALPILRLAMALLALAMELESGLAFDDAQRLTAVTDDNPEAIARSQMAVRLRMAATAAQIVKHSNEGVIFEKRFWSRFYRAMFAYAKRKALGKLLAASIVALLAGAIVARADGQPLNLVIAIDLSASVAATESGGKTDFEKNVTAVSSLLNNVPAGSRVTIIGITQDSLAEPNILLSATVDNDPGYFGERLRSAHSQLAESWRRKSAQLLPTSKRTDILGVLMLAGQVFRETKTHEIKALVIYSDMRQDTRSLNLSDQDMIPSDSHIKRAATNQPNLKNVQVFALGVDAAGKDSDYWVRLRRFWITYFDAAGAVVSTYSVLRGSPSLWIASPNSP